MRGDAKIRPSHLGRQALVYVRQSTLAQVRNNTESTQRQYALAAEAARLGWAASCVEVIDADLGLSGASTTGRSGFKEIVGRVCVGEVGAIFGLEVSRLARSSADLSSCWSSPASPTPWSSMPTASMTSPTSTTASCSA
ncbi:MAG TPA: recombinase family protein [Actinomycetota bacterium]|nr:recombinase family protein [Actinomycetota bacterium]